MARKKQEPEQIVPTGQLYVEPLEKVLHSSMLPYAEFVILDRALPRVEDGLKPVQRRILFTMHEMGLTPDKPHKKSARIVGDCMGKFHPHGDSSVYDAMVRMAQNFNMGKTLVNGHGNFGSVDGDPAAAMRYTEARMEPLALELLRDIDKETVTFSLNFDDSLKEPDILPGRFPNLLVNGASGIAVGLATNIPTHNLEEVINGVIAYIDNPAISLEEMMEYIPSPDFPTGGLIIANELIQAYKTGRGKITIRAKINAEKTDNGKTNLIITELPYNDNTGDNEDSGNNEQLPPVTNPFTDISENQYYYQPVLWAYENEITTGLKPDKFGPEESCTRGQVVTFLWRAMGEPEPTITEHSFVDVANDAYYYKAVLWAVEKGITNGYDATHFAPEETVTRAQFVTFLHRAENKPQSNIINPFIDITRDAYYYNAVLWAYDEGITTGLTRTDFGPEDFCTRGQVVTFLYRALK